MWVETVVPCVWRSDWICLAVDRGAFSTIQTILHCNLRSSFLLWPHPGRLATVPWALNFLLTLRTVYTGTSRSLQMDCSLEIVHAWRQSCVWPAQTMLWFSFFSPCSLWYTQWHKTAECLLCSIQTGWMSDFYIAGTCNSPLVRLGMGHALEQRVTIGEFNSNVKENHLLEIYWFLPTSNRCQYYCLGHFRIFCGMS